MIYSTTKTRKGAKLIAGLCGMRTTVSLEMARNAPFIIHWGTKCAESFSRKPRLNSNLHLVRNKLTELTMLRDGDIRTVPFSENPDSVSYPAFGRLFNHRAGTDIRLCLSRLHADYAKSNFYSEYIDSKTEYRVHVFRNWATDKYNVFRIQEKYLESPFSNKPYCRSRGNGFHLRNVNREQWRDFPVTVRQLATKACRVLNRDFAAFDIIVTPDDIPYILEANSAPGCDDLGASLYATRFRSWADSL
jgi:hypothetical protein